MSYFSNRMAHHGVMLVDVTISGLVFCLAASTPTNESTSTTLVDYCYGCKLNSAVYRALFFHVFVVVVISRYSEKPRMDAL